MTHKITGLVVRTVDLTGSDKLLSILTAERGLLVAVANGSRSLRSRYLAASQLFCYATFVLESRGERFWVREAELVESFFDLRLNIVSTALAHYVCEVAADVTVPEQPDPAILQLTLNTLHAIAGGRYSHAHIKAAFEFRMAVVLGYLPDLSSCGGCGKEEGEMLLDVMNGALLCSECHAAAQGVLPLHEDDFRARTRVLLCILTPAVRRALSYLATCPPERLLSFRLSEEEMCHLSRAAEEYLLNHLERGFRTLQFYKDVALDNG